MKGKAVVLVIGWESKEAHLAFRETDTFKENIHFLRQGMGGAEMVSLMVSRRGGDVLIRVCSIMLSLLRSHKTSLELSSDSSCLLCVQYWAFRCI